MQVLGAVSHLEGETVAIDDWQITVVDVEGRYIHLLELAPTQKVGDLS